MDKYRVIIKHSEDTHDGEIERFRYRKDAQDYIKHRIKRVTEGFSATPVQVCVWKENGRKTDWQVNVKGSAPFSIRYTIEPIQEAS